MNTFDIIVIIVVSICLIRGAFRGLIGEVSGIIGVVAGFYGAYTYYPMLAQVAEPWVSSETFLNLISFFALFIGILLVIALVSVLIRKLLKLVFLGWVDRGFGLVFGAAKGVLMMTVIFIIVTTFLPKNSSFLKNSYSSPYLAQASKALTIFVSNNAKSDYIKNLERLFKF